jgi:transposase
LLQGKRILKEATDRYKSRRQSVPLNRLALRRFVREYVAQAMLRTREMFVPLSHCPGHAQADFGEADGYIGGKKVRFHYFCMDLPHSDGCFVKAYPAETAEAFCDGHVAAFDFFGGVPKSILYDNTKLAVAKIVKSGRRQRSKMFAELQRLKIALGDQARATIKARWKVWSAMSGAIS